MRTDPRHDVSLRLLRWSVRALLAAAPLAACASPTNSSYTPNGSSSSRDAAAPPSGSSGDDASSSSSSGGGGDDSGTVTPPTQDDGGGPSSGSSTVSLPFYVSDEFIPSGFMGDSPAAMNGIKLSHAATDCKSPRAPGVGGDCYTVSWTAALAQGATSSWAGVYWQSPANNWGAKPGKTIQTGAKKVSFYAAGGAGGEKVQFCAGGINTKGSDPTLTYRDQFTVNLPAVTLTTDWQKYEISLDGATYDAVLGGFCWVASATASGTETFYIDDVRWE